MTPEQRAAFIESTLVIWDLLASYGNEQAGELARALRDHGEALDDDLVIRAVDRVLRVSAHELVTMGLTLRTAVAMGSDYGAAFAAAQTEPARKGNLAKGDRQARRARAWADKGLKPAQIGYEMAREDERMTTDNDGRRVVDPYDAGEVRRWFRRRLPEDTST